jgi:mannonate dehydratase
MKQAWRLFGLGDPVTLDAVRQAGATDTVSALPLGEAWTLADIERHRNVIESTPPGHSPLSWSVIESIPVADDIKRHGVHAQQLIASLEAAAQGGPKIVCYNFLLMVDWTRTDLDWPLPTGQRRCASTRMHSRGVSSTLCPASVLRAG